MLTLKHEIEVYGTIKLTNKNLVTICNRKHQHKQQYSNFVDRLVQKIITKRQTNDRDLCTMFTIESTLSQLLLLTVEQCCSEMFGLTIQSWQKEVAENVMTHQNSTILLVKPTGNGKLLVRDVVAVAL